MAKRKGTKGQRMIYETLHRKQDWVTRTPPKPGYKRVCSRRVGFSCPINNILATLRINHIT
jgi:hypothetical protein